MLQIGQRVISKRSKDWRPGSIIHCYISLGIVVCEVLWEDQYVGGAWEKDLVPVPSENLSSYQKQAIVELTCYR